MKIYDCSRPIGDDTATFPGDTPATVTRVRDMSKGGFVNQSDMTLGLHTATHVDAPMHFIADGKNLDQIPLDRYIGPCRVIAVEDRPIISADDLKGYTFSEGEIILFKTDNSKKPLAKEFDRGFVALDKSAAEILRDSGVKTVGIDYQSIENGPHSVHITLLGAGLSLIEGLYFRDVPAGEYFLSSAPLKITGAEGAPCRAVLIEL